MLDEEDPISGYDAIVGPRPVQMPIGPTATRRLKRMPNGLVTTVFVDANGVEVNPNGYQILDSSPEADLGQLGLDPLKDEKETIAQEVKSDIQPSPYDRRGGGDGGSIGRGSSSRTAMNNFGYMDKPGWMGVTSFAPGPIGLAAKAANLGVNANNSAAVSQARSMIGVPDMGAVEKAKSYISDRQGQVADVDIGDQKYSVGFEAMSPDNKTNLTPNEARNRALTLGGISLTDPSAVKKGPETAPESRGVLSGFFSEARSFIDNMFSDVKNAVTGGTSNSFPTAPSPAGSSGGSKGERSYDGKSYSGQNAGNDTPSEKSGIGRGSPMKGGQTGGSRAEANKGGGGVSGGGKGLW